MQAQMNTEEVKDALGVMWLSWQVGLRKLGPEAGRIDQSAGSDMIGMCVFPVRSQQITRTKASQHSGQPSPRIQIRDESPVRQAQITSPVQAKKGAGRLGLRAANVRAAVRRRFTVG